MNWYDKSFDELTVNELFQVYKLRTQVFNAEQDSSYPDPDDEDLVARHIFYKDNGQVVAYARYFMDGDHATFGRVVIAKGHRGTGLSTPLMNHIMAGIEKHFPDQEIIIHAQYYVRSYYAKFGFTSVGDPFIEADRKHISMKHPAL